MYSNHLHVAMTIARKLAHFTLLFDFVLK